MYFLILICLLHVSFLSGKLNIASARLLAVLELHLKMLAGGLVILLCSKVGICVQFAGWANEILRVSI